jgi:hypothetical protein
MPFQLSMLDQKLLTAPSTSLFQGRFEVLSFNGRATPSSVPVGANMLPGFYPGIEERMFRASRGDTSRPSVSSTGGRCHFDAPSSSDASSGFRCPSKFRCPFKASLKGASYLHRRATRGLVPVQANMLPGFHAGIKGSMLRASKRGTSRPSVISGKSSMPFRCPLNFRCPSKFRCPFIVISGFNT